MRPLPSLRFSIYMFVVCDKGKGRPLGELKATFSTALKVLQCSKTIMSYDQSQCVLLALCVCALGRGLAEKVLGLGQRRAGVGSPPPPSEGGGGPPPPLQPPKLSNTPRGHTLAGGGPVDIVLCMRHACRRVRPAGAFIGALSTFGSRVDLLRVC